MNRRRYFLGSLYRAILMFLSLLKLKLQLYQIFGKGDSFKH